MSLRRLFYINPKIQFPFTALLVGLVSAELIAFGIAMVLVDRLASRLTQDLGIYLRYGSMLLAVLLFATVNLVISTKLSHRFAGPIVQILRVLRLAQRGVYSARVNNRAGDFLNDVSDALNDLLQTLNRSDVLNAPEETVSSSPSSATTSQRKEEPLELYREEGLR